MGGAHAHRAGGDSADSADSADLEIAHAPRAVLLGTLVIAALATVVGLVALWPDGDRVGELTESVSFAAPGVTFPHAIVERVDGEQLTVTVDDGADRGNEARLDVAPEVAESGLVPGDDIRLIRTPGADGRSATYGYFGTVRTGPTGLLLAVFVLTVLVVARWRGLMALLGLAFASFVVLTFMLPALLTGESGLLVGLIGSAAIMYVVLYSTHGLSIRTSAALAGTLIGVAITAGIGLLSIRSSRLAGVADESGGLLSTLVDDVSFQGLMTCAIIVAGLGVLNDVTITQASAVWELRGAAPDRTRRQLFAGGMRIGRDHIASTIYTIVFAYTGTALIVLLLLQVYGLPLLDLLATEEIGQEVVRTLATSIGLVLAVPVTTAIAVATVPGPKPVV
jgi:uncharacterized membrane protein